MGKCANKELRAQGDLVPHKAVETREPRRVNRRRDAFRGVKMRSNMRTAWTQVVLATAHAVYRLLYQRSPMRLTPAGA